MRSLPEHASQPPAQDAEALDRADLPVPAHEPRVVSALLARVQARVRATGRELDENDLATLVAQEPALAGATVERGAYGELAIDLAGGEPWATLSPVGQLDWVASEVPTPETPSPDSAAFARGRQQFKAQVALLSRRERQLATRAFVRRRARRRPARVRRARARRPGVRRVSRCSSARGSPDDSGDGESDPAGGREPRSPHRALAEAAPTGGSLSHRAHPASQQGQP